MLRKLEAVYEQGVLRPLEPLSLAEHQRVHLTLEDRPEQNGQEPAIPINERHDEMRWLARESGPFAGQWVALDGARLLAHGRKLAEVRAEALAAGVEDPFLASVPDNDLPFGGW